MWCWIVLAVQGHFCSSDCMMCVVGVGVFDWSLCVAPCEVWGGLFGCVCSGEVVSV